MLGYRCRFCCYTSPEILLVLLKMGFLYFLPFSIERTSPCCLKVLTDVEVFLYCYWTGIERRRFCRGKCFVSFLSCWRKSKCASIVLCMLSGFAVWVDTPCSVVFGMELGRLTAGSRRLHCTNDRFPLPPLMWVPIHIVGAHWLTLVILFFELGLFDDVGLKRTV